MSFAMSSRRVDVDEKYERKGYGGEYLNVIEGTNRMEKITH
jgi:hypothetical protein